MFSTLTIVTPATTYDLTVLATVKTELEITGTADDAFLSTLIRHASGDIAGYCDRVFAEETVTETFWLGDPAHCGDPWRGYKAGWVHWKYGAGTSNPLQLARWPVTEVTSVVEDETTLTADDYLLKTSNGLLWRLSETVTVPWTGLTVAVTYTAGYALLGDLPYELERACLDLVKLRYYARSRDPMLRSEQILDVTRSDWTTASPYTTHRGLPVDIAGRLEGYRRIEL